MALFVYNLLLILLSPVLLLYLAWRLWKGKEDRSHWAERWGRLGETVSEDPRTPRFWVHAVSVGEVMAAAPVLRALRARFPGAFILLSTITPSGREVAQKQVPPADEVVYFPLDIPRVVRRALAAARPDAVLLMEWEIWPNFLVAARRCHPGGSSSAAVAVLNGRVSDRGLRRGGHASFFTRPGLDAVSLFAMQSEEDARRAALVGAEPDRIVTLGNTKFDEAVVPLSADQRAALRAELNIAPDAPVWVCGSTRPGEEAFLAQAATQFRKPFPYLFMIVAPRHLERADEAEGALRSVGMTVARRRSQEKRPPPPVPLPHGGRPSPAGRGRERTGYGRRFGFLLWLPLPQRGEGGGRGPSIHPPPGHLWRIGAGVRGGRCRLCWRVAAAVRRSERFPATGAGRSRRVRAAHEQPA